MFLSQVNVPNRVPKPETLTRSGTRLCRPTTHNHGQSDPQRVNHNPRVGGSSPPSGTLKPWQYEVTRMANLAMWRLSRAVEALDNATGTWLAADQAQVGALLHHALSPLDTETIEASARKTGRVVVVHEAPGFLGMGAELAARITERCFFSLEAPVLRVTGFDTPYPPSRVEEEYLPDLDRILDAVDRSLTF